MERKRLQGLRVHNQKQNLSLLKVLRLLAPKLGLLRQQDRVNVWQDTCV
jgi:hypothetical protein